MLAVDSFVLHKSGRRPDLAHRFIDFMLEGEQRRRRLQPDRRRQPQRRGDAASSSRRSPPSPPSSRRRRPARRLEMLRDFDPTLRRTLSRLWTEIKVR